MSMRFRDHTNQRFGRLVGQWPAGRQGRHIIWLCLCDCGTLTLIRSGSLQTGHTRSCGCAQRDSARKLLLKHGHTSNLHPAPPEYRSWNSMIGRCFRACTRGYTHYGGAGITVCERWRSFELFFADLRHRPPGMTLGRVKDMGNYEPGNARWMTRKEQTEQQRLKRRFLGHH